MATAASLGANQPDQTPIGPTRPQVPMPEETGAPFISSLKTQVAMGPVMAEVTMAGSQMRGFLTMLPIWSMEVPSPWDTSPPHLFSRKLMTAKPTICAQQPATAAPPARPVTDRGAGYRQRQRDADYDGYGYAHEEGLKLGSEHDELSYPACGYAYRLCDEVSEADSDEYRHERRHEDVHLRLLGDDLAELAGDYRYYQDGERAARAAEAVGSPADGRKGKEHQRRAVQRVAYRYRHGGAGHLGGEASDGIEKRQMRLRPYRVEYRTDEKAAEKTLRHRAERVDAVSFAAYDDILALEKGLEFAHLSAVLSDPVIYRA